MENPPLSILVVEDDENVGLYIETVLDRIGHSVSLTTKGTDAIKLLRQKHFDITISDFMLPDFDGRELLQWVGDNDISTYFVIMTAFYNESVRCEFMKLGAKLIQDKPIAKKDILNIVEQFLQSVAHNGRVEKGINTTVDSAIENNKVEKKITKTSDSGIKSTLENPRSVQYNQNSHLQNLSQKLLKEIDGCLLVAMFDLNKSHCVAKASSIPHTQNESCSRLLLEQFGQLDNYFSLTATYSHEASFAYFIIEHQYHILKYYKKNGYGVYIVADKNIANLGLLRLALREVQESFTRLVNTL